MRRLAETALVRYGISGARLSFLQYEGNFVFRVDTPGAGRYVLRIHTSANAPGIESELTWLAALRNQGGLQVPEPVPTAEGELLTSLHLPGDGRAWHVSLMRWVYGRRLRKGVLPTHARAWGTALGRVHEFARGWRPPPGFKRMYLGWNGLYRQEGGLRYPPDELTAMMPARYRQAFHIVTGKVRRVMENLGEGPDVFGMVHGDMYLENVLFRSGEARIIDFDDCGFGYWMYDIGTALSEWPWTDQWHRIKDALLEGYTAVHPLPQSQLVHVDLFMAAQYAVLTLWGTAFIKANPGMREEHERWRNRGGENLLRYLALHRPQKEG
jgi:Ser/Thr protein kinase RdoA (MazF antagonist)